MLLDVGAIDEDDLRLDRDLRRANVETLDVASRSAIRDGVSVMSSVLVAVSAATEPRAEQLAAVAWTPARPLPAVQSLREQPAERLNERSCAGVVDGDELRDSGSEDCFERCSCSCLP